MINPFVKEVVPAQRKYYDSGQTRSIRFRLEQLERLRDAIMANEEALLDALKADLNKPQLEAYSAEIALTLAELEYTIKRLPGWAQEKRVHGSLGVPAAICSVKPEPLGVVFIISPWNFPVLLTLVPLIGAIAAGNCVVIKPSELSVHCAGALSKIISDSFTPDYVALVEGEADTAEALLEERFDHVFFTGSTAVGRKVMQAAARHLCPVTLELGGKSPCIVEKDADLAMGARRIAWGKFSNAGQICIAPDYVLIRSSVKEAFIKEMINAIELFYGSDPQVSPDYGRIINDRHFARLQPYLGSGHTRYGGTSDAAQRYIAPTLLDEVSWDDPVMQDEIFGPILPILEYDEIDEAISHINQRPKPLALYLFTTNRRIQKRVIWATSSGGVCINDTVSHTIPHSLPFGGVGESGMGAYHGQATFDTFTHYKSILRAPSWPEIRAKYPPYTGTLQQLKRLAKYI